MVSMNDEKRAPTKKERRRQREADRRKQRTRDKFTACHFEESDQDFYDRMRLQQAEKRSKELTKLKEEQSATQCYNSWEFDETITVLIATSPLKWKCSKSEAKQKLAASLWTSDQSIDDQLERVRRKHEGANNTNDLDELDLYEIKLNTLAPTKSDVEQEIELSFPDQVPFDCPV